MSNNKTTQGGAGCVTLVLAIVQASMIVLKLGGITEITWARTLAPTIAFIGFVLGALAGLGVIGFLYKLVSDNETKDQFVAAIIALIGGLLTLGQVATLALSFSGVWDDISSVPVTWAITPLFGLFLFAIAFVLVSALLDRLK